MLHIECLLTDKEIELVVKKAITQWFYSIDRPDVRIFDVPQAVESNDSIMLFRDSGVSGDNTFYSPARLYTVFIYENLYEVEDELQKFKELFSIICSNATASQIQQQVTASIWQLVDIQQLQYPYDKQKLQIKENGVYYLLKLVDVMYFEHEIHLRRIRIVTMGKDYLYRSSLTAIMTMLPSYFCRCHHGAIVNLQKISRIDREQLLVYFENGSFTRVSVRGYYQLLRALKAEGIYINR